MALIGPLYGKKDIANRLIYPTGSRTGKQCAPLTFRSACAQIRLFQVSAALICQPDNKEYI